MNECRLKSVQTAFLYRSVLWFDRCVFQTGSEVFQIHTCRFCATDDFVNRHTFCRSAKAPQEGAARTGSAIGKDGIFGLSDELSEGFDIMVLDVAGDNGLVMESGNACFFQPRASLRKVWLSFFLMIRAVADDGFDTQ